MKNTTITIRNFVEEYNKRPEQTKESYLKDNLVITKYVPFIMKNALAEKLINVSTYKFEDYTKDDGTIGRRKTDTIHVDSVVQYLLFCRLVIENYTNLTIETETFYEEYDLLKQSGLLDKLMVGTETVEPIIPISELSELRSLCDMKQKDELFNATEIHNYVSSQVERVSDLLNVIAKPIMDRVVEKLDGISAEDIKNIRDFMEVNK